MRVPQESVCVPSILTEVRGWVPRVGRLLGRGLRAGSVLGSILAEAQPVAARCLCPSRCIEREGLGQRVGKCSLGLVLGSGQHVWTGHGCLLCAQPLRPA